MKLELEPEEGRELLSLIVDRLAEEARLSPGVPSHCRLQSCSGI
ncbi:MAG: hypothetical protein HW393_441 [Dehalococcoidia bacterium]|nr:hypothetical protein [Dehalococcoidia bacterium]